MHNESTITPVLHKFVVYAPDKAEEGTLERRLSVRAQHLENAQPLISAGIISMFDTLLLNESMAHSSSSSSYG